jgi:type IV secretion system protein VirB9
MIRRSLFAAALLLTTTSALAEDPRLVERTYDPDAVVTIEGKVNVQATIAFGEDELIENVAIGDANSWQVTPNKRANLLFVKPLTAKASTNMTVVTDKHTYLFDLVARATAKPVYVLRFSYPDEPGKDDGERLAQGPNADELAAASDPYAVADPARLNFAWTTKGDATLLPTRTYDDGDATFLTWPADRSVPAILIKDAKGLEGPVNYAVRGNVIVVEGVPREIILRAGEGIATLINQGPVRPAATADTALAHVEEAP